MIYGCELCGKFYAPTGPRAKVVELLRDIDNFPCITSLCTGRLVRAPVAFNTGAVPIPIERFFQAVNGFGFHEGVLAKFEHVCKLLTTKKIVQVVGEGAGDPERTILTRLVLEDGTRLHFANSSLGACIYRIEEPGKELKNGSSTVSLEGGSPSFVADREEAGRGPRGDEEAGGTSSTEARLYPPGVPTVPQDSAVLPGGDRRET